MIIGRATRTATGFLGNLEMPMNEIPLNIVKNNPKHSVSSPDYKILSNKGHEIGYGITKLTKLKKEFILIKIDDPTFFAPMYARIVFSGPNEIEHMIFWDRSRGKSSH